MNDSEFNSKAVYEEEILETVESMNLVRQREVIVEIERLQVVRKRARTHMHYCGGCGALSDFVTAHEAAKLFDTPGSSLLNFVRANNCHNHMAISELHICLVSLLAVMKNGKDRNHTKLLKGDEDEN